MNTLIWIGQILLAAVFFVAGVARLVANKRQIKTIEGPGSIAPVGMNSMQGTVVGLLEIAGAIGVIVPPAWTPDALALNYLSVRLAAVGLAILMVVATFYHFRRKESASPSISAFLLALFVIVGRWPH
jgi:uncharacterized membrane protein YphA (DoxX/SURF4 family)